MIRAIVCNRQRKAPPMNNGTPPFRADHVGSFRWFLHRPGATGEIETANELKRRIDEAARYVPLEQLALSPQCGFSSTVLGNNITVEADIAKLALVVRVAGEVWG